MALQGVCKPRSAGNWLNFFDGAPVSLSSDAKDYSVFTPSGGRTRSILQFLPEPECTARSALPKIIDTINRKNMPAGDSIGVAVDTAAVNEGFEGDSIGVAVNTAAINEVIEAARASIKSTTLPTRAEGIASHVGLRSKTQSRADIHCTASLPQCRRPCRAMQMQAICRMHFSLFFLFLSLFFFLFFSPHLP